MKLSLPEEGLVLLVGASGSGKSSFAREHFLPTEVVSSDVCRGLVSDDENDQKATGLAFELLRTMVCLRLRNRRFTVVDATNLRPEDRKELRQIASDHDTLTSALLFDIPREVCKERNAQREDRNFSHRVIDRHGSLFRQTCRSIKKEKFHRIYRLTPELIDSARIERTKLWNDRRELTGPFDIVGDIHGCAGELSQLLEKLGYQDSIHPEGRQLIFLGDITDRGPKSLACLRMVQHAVERGALCVSGNHDVKLKRYLEGRKVVVSHGLETTAKELEESEESEREGIRAFLDGLISHYVLDGGNLVVAHAGIKQEYQGKASSRVRNFCLYGDTTGEVDEFGLPVRLNWAADYRGEATVVYGHTPVPEAIWLNRTINIDTGCVFGGKLTALRYPELELVSVQAERVYSEPTRPVRSAETTRPNELKISDVLGKQILSTRLIPNITIPAEQSGAALEVFSRFAVPPEWLVYLPPTMAPCSTSEGDDYLEYPTEAFSYFQSREQTRVICQEKHMGSRAVLYLKRSGEGRCLTRTGRAFFAPRLESQLVQSLASTLEKNGFWDDFQSELVVLDAELMPWSAKAQALLQEQYAAVGAASLAALPAVLESLKDQDPELRKRQETRLQNAMAFRKAYRNYCWSTRELEGLKLAPFHLLASTQSCYFDKTHRWHLETLARYLQGNPVFCPTRTLEVDLKDPASIQAACSWWEQLTESGGEGMVVKPEIFLAFGKGGLLQPALKVRGREYLRIIYGPDYTEHLPALRRRAMSRKRSLALREFALGVESLESFVAGAPHYEVQRYVFAVLALESEAVDPRL